MDRLRDLKTTTAVVVVLGLAFVGVLLLTSEGEPSPADAHASDPASSSLHSSSTDAAGGDEQPTADVPPSDLAPCALPDGYAERVANGQMDGEAVCKVLAGNKERLARIQDNPAGEMNLRVEGKVGARNQAAACDKSGGRSDAAEEAERLACAVVDQILAGELSPTGTCDPPTCPEPATPVWAYGESELLRVGQGTGDGQ